MKFSADEMAQKHVTDLSPYKAGQTAASLARELGIQEEGVVKLNANENPYGPSRQAREAIHSIASVSNRYPDVNSLVAAVSKGLNVAPEQIVLGSGSTEVFDFIARVFLGPGTEALSSEYGFSIYRTFTLAANSKNVLVKANSYGHDLDEFLENISERTRVIWIANPNNPTGTFVPYPQVKAFLAKVSKDVIVVLDEAYYEYLAPKIRDESHAWVNQHPNLVVVRTFSKIHALAGLRIGYAIADKSVADLLRRVKQPMNITSAGVKAAEAAIKDSEHTALSRKRNQQGISQLKEGADKLGLDYLPAYGNFITLKFNYAQKIYNYLLKRGVMVRPVAGYGLPEYLRVTVGTPSENTKLLGLIKECLADM